MTTKTSDQKSSEAAAQAAPATKPRSNAAQRAPAKKAAPRAQAAAASEKKRNDPFASRRVWPD